MQKYSLTQKIAAETIGTSLLLATIVGSGIMASSLSQGNNAIALLGNTIPTGCMLVVLIFIFGPVSGAHFNPAVTFCFWLQRQVSDRDALIYIVVQITAAIAGTMLAHVMFGMPELLMTSTKARDGFGQLLGEFVASFGLVATILGCIQQRKEALPFAVGLFICAAYWFTSSTSFANPAVTIGRTMTNSFSGIQSTDALGFIGAQLVGAIAATCICKWLYAPSRGD